MGEWPKTERAGVVNILCVRASRFVRLQLWLQGHSDQFDFGDFKLQFLTLSSEEQFRFVRKLFRDADEKKMTLSIELLSDLVRFDYEGDSDWEVDCSVDIAIKAISDLAAGNLLNEERNIGQVLVKHFDRKAFRKYRIRDLFDKCEGRGEAVGAHNDPDGRQTEIKYRRTGVRPPAVTYCEGRSAPKPDDALGVQFWWCRRQPCFMQCHGGHGVEQWERYVMSDMLRILGIDFNRDHYHDFLGMLNRADALLEHLNCRSCERIMVPSGQRSYAFYRVTSFRCSNEVCSNKQDVYLNHCLGRKCGVIIDSRDSAECPNGWRICTQCQSCCSTKVAEGIIGSRLPFGIPVSEKLDKLVTSNSGHAEKKVWFCHACGTELVGSSEKYYKALQWFLQRRSSDVRIKSSGKRPSDGGWWFIVDFPEDKYTSLRDLGFEIHPPMRGGGKMVSTPRGGVEYTHGRCPKPACGRFGIQT